MSEQRRIQKIVVIGPESTGKSTLCEALAARYHTRWCPEYARSYLLKHGTNYTYDDLMIIAKGQLELEDQYTKALEDITGNASLQKPLLFIDTDMYVMKVWCEFVFGKCPTWILDRIVERNYDLYLFCKPDLPWVKDELREYPDEATRIKLYHHYKALLTEQPVPWAEISGTSEDRIKKAIAAIDNNLQ